MTVRDVLNAVIEYETPRYVKVHNPLVGLVLRGSQVRAVYCITALFCTTIATRRSSLPTSWAGPFCTSADTRYSSYVTDL